VNDFDLFLCRQISNEEEAKMVIDIIRNIHLVLESEKKSESSGKKLTIGVVTPYSTQRTAISKDIKRLKFLLISCHHSNLI
jgi:hypothetical protein